MSSRNRFFSSRDLALIIVFSSLGAVVSVPVGHLGNFLKTIPVLPFGVGQFLAGVHVLWIVLAATLVGRRGSGTMTGILKGLVEMALFSYHGVQVILISAVEGAVVDLVLLPFTNIDVKSLYLSGGLASASNVAVLQFVLRLPLPTFVYAFMYLASFISGLFFAGQIAKIVHKIVSETPLAV